MAPDGPPLIITTTAVAGFGGVMGAGVIGAVVIGAGVIGVAGKKTEEE